MSPDPTTRAMRRIVILGGVLLVALASLSWVAAGVVSKRLLAAAAVARESTDYQRSRGAITASHGDSLARQIIDTVAVTAAERRAAWNETRAVLRAIQKDQRAIRREVVPKVDSLLMGKKRPRG